MRCSRAPLPSPSGCGPRPRSPRPPFRSRRWQSIWPRRSSAIWKARAFTWSARARCANWLRATCWRTAPSKIYVGNRTFERAAALAKKFNGEAIPFEQLYDTVDRADIVISSTGAPHTIFRKEHGEKFLSRRRNRPMFFIDIAVPRDVDPEMNKLDGIFVYDIDDLQQVVSSHISDRRVEADRAEAIVQLEVDKFQARLQTLDVVPTIVSLQEHLETVRQAEIDRVRGRLGTLTPEQETGGRSAVPRHHQQDHAYTDYYP